MKIAAMIVLALGLAVGAARAQSQEKPAGPAIESGSTVKFEYTLTDDAGKVLDSNKGQDPSRTRTDRRRFSRRWRTLSKACAPAIIRK